MNNHYVSPQYHSHKKRLQTDDLELSSYGLPRKKFISEESFTKEMAAMSLETGRLLIIDKQRESRLTVYITDLQLKQQQEQQQQQQQYFQYYNDRFRSNFIPSPTIQHDKNVIRIDHLSDDDEDEYNKDTQIQSNNMIYMDINGKKAIVDNNLNGLPLELRPGEHKPRIPDFVLENSE